MSRDVLTVYRTKCLDGSSFLSAIPILNTKSRTLDAREMVTLARLALIIIQLNNEDGFDSKKLFKSQSVATNDAIHRLTEYPVWITIFHFLYSAAFNIFDTKSVLPPLTRLAINFARPSMLIVEDIVVRAALCGDQDLAQRLIKNNSAFLLTRATVKNFQDKIYQNITPLQAALIGGDARMLQMILIHANNLLVDVDGVLIDWRLEMRSQFIEIYKKSLRVYLEKQKSQIELSILSNSQLYSSKNEYAFYRECVKAVRGNDIQFIFEIHRGAQKKNVFDFDSILSAINIAPECEISSMLDNRDGGSEFFLQLSVFRNEFANQVASEVIFNPEHLVHCYDQCYRKMKAMSWDQNKIDAACYLVLAFVMRYVSAAVAQAFSYGIASSVDDFANYPRLYSHRSSAWRYYFSLIGREGLGYGLRSIGSASGVIASAHYVECLKGHYENLLLKNKLLLKSLMDRSLGGAVASDLGCGGDLFSCVIQ